MILALPLIFWFFGDSDGTDEENLNFGIVENTDVADTSAKRTLL